MTKKRMISLAAALAAGFVLTACGGTAPKLKADMPVEKEFQEVSVHDPAIVEGEDGEYYIFGSHLAVAKTDDLMNWTYVNQGVKDDNPIIPDVYKVMKDAFEWSHSNTYWAPEVVRSRNGKYLMYYCNCQEDTPVSCLGLAVSDQVEGPYENQGLLLKSGMGADELDEDGNLYQATVDPNTVVSFFRRT